MGTLDKRVAEMQQMHQNAAQSREGYRQAFIAQTGLMPDKVAMLYGEELVEEGGHILKRFKVRYVPHDIADELRELESQIEQLTLKNCAMQMVIAPLSVKAGISDEAVIELLKAAESELVESAVGEPRKLSGCEYEDGRGFCNRTFGPDDTCEHSNPLDHNLVGCGKAL